MEGDVGCVGLADDRANVSCMGSVDGGRVGGWAAWRGWVAFACVEVVEAWGAWGGRVGDGDDRCVRGCV